MENQTNNLDNTHELEAHLHPDTPEEMKKLMLDFTKSASALQNFINETKAHLKEEANPANYVGFSCYVMFNNGSKSKTMQKRALNIDDFFTLYDNMKKEISELTN